MLARKYLAGLGAILIIGAACFAYGAYDQQTRRVSLAADLNIHKLPDSAQIVRCESPPDVITDIVYKCVLAIEKDDFPLLLRGYKYKHYGYTFEAWPKQFQYGGRVSVEANPSNTQATIDVYIE